MGLFNSWRPTMVKLPKESDDYLVTEQQTDERIINVAHYDSKEKKWKYRNKNCGGIGYKDITNIIVAWKKLPKTF